MNRLLAGRWIVAASLVAVVSLVTRGDGIAFADDTKVAKTGKAAEPTTKPADKPTDKTVSLARLEIEGELPESGGLASLFAETSDSLRDTIKRLETAAQDKKVFGIVLSLRDTSLGMGKVNELRAAIHAARRSGKRIYADIQDVTGPAYLVACACDEIMIPPAGALAIPGVRAELTFYKGLLDKVGVKADMLQVGKYKGAAESMTRDSMSPEFRAQYESVINDYFELTVETIAADRRLPEAKVRELLDRGLFSPSDAKAAGLVDRVAYEDEFRDQLKTQYGAEKLTVIEKYGEKKADLDLSGMGGMMKMLDLFGGGDAKPAATNKNAKIAVIYVVGTIVTGESSASLFGGETVGSDTIIKALRTANDDATVKAIVLRVDSPGGSALASDLIWRETQRLSKPMVASMGDTAASGGYYVSMGAKKIYAEPGTLTGSIGVVGGKMVFGGLYDKLGVKTEVIGRGRNSGIFSDSSPFSDSERSAWQRMMEETYQQFTSKAAAGRKLEVSKIDELAQGRVWTGRQAKERGLVDTLGTLPDAIAEAKSLAGLKPEDKVEQMILPKPGGLLEKLLGGSLAESRIKSALPQTAATMIGDMETLRKLFAEPSVVIMPYRVRVR